MIEIAHKALSGLRAPSSMVVVRHPKLGGTQAILLDLRPILLLHDTMYSGRPLVDTVRGRGDVPQA